MRKITGHRALKKVFMPHKVISPIIETVTIDEPKTSVDENTENVEETQEVVEEIQDNDKQQNKKTKKTQKNCVEESGTTENK